MSAPASSASRPAYEFTTLLEDILDVGGEAPPLERKTIDALAQLEEDIHIQVFVTPT